MSKASSNAGKHNYLRSDREDLFKHIKFTEGGISLKGFNPIYKEQKIATEYVDKFGKKLHYRDVISYKDEDYRIDYNSKEFYWILVNLTDPKNTQILKKTAHLTVFRRKV